MFQPSHMPVSHFTREQITEISRGRTIKIRPSKPDPVVGIVKRYGEQFVRWEAACKEHDRIKRGLRERDRGWAQIGLPDEIAKVFTFGTTFTSVAHLRARFRSVIAYRRRTIKQANSLIRKRGLENFKGFEEIPLERNRMKQEIETLLVCQPLLERQLVREERRLLRIQTKSGLLKAREARGAAFRNLSQTIKKLSKCQPQSIDGALALIQYMEMAMRHADRSRAVSFEQDAADQAAILARARNYLKRKAA